MAASRCRRGQLIGLCYGTPWRWADQADPWAHQLRERLGEPRAALLEGAFAVHLLAVDPRHQRGGLGRRLLRATLDAADAARAWLVTTDVDSPAVRLYRRLGWRRLGHGPDAPDGRPAAVLVIDRHG